jgi:hypothetical protein
VINESCTKTPSVAASTFAELDHVDGGSRGPPPGTVLYVAPVLVNPEDFAPTDAVAGVYAGQELEPEHERCSKGALDARLSPSPREIRTGICSATVVPWIVPVQGHFFSCSEQGRGHVGPTACLVRDNQSYTSVIPDDYCQKWEVPHGSGSYKDRRKQFNQHLDVWG